MNCGLKPSSRAMHVPMTTNTAQTTIHINVTARTETNGTADPQYMLGINYQKLHEKTS